MAPDPGRQGLKPNAGELLRLVERARAGDRAALERLTEAILPYASALARAHCGGRLEAEDVLQESLLELCRSLESLADPRDFLPWLRALVRNNAADRGRRRASHREVPLPPGVDRPAPPERNGEDSGTEAAEVRAQILAELARLEAPDRELLGLRHEAGLSMEEIARVTGMSVRAVESRLFRARRVLRQRLFGRLRP